MLGGGIEGWTKFLYQNLLETSDVPQRGSQIVRNRVGKSFQLFVGGFQLCGALHYSLLEFVVEFADFPRSEALVRVTSRKATTPPRRTPSSSFRGRPVTSIQTPCSSFGFRTNISTSAASPSTARTNGSWSVGNGVTASGK